MDGPAESISLPRSSNSARTRPNCSPATTESPILSVPRLTSTVATAPRPRSTLASSTQPTAGASCTALSSSTSACNRSDSSNFSMPSPVFAETGTKMFSPPHSSAITPSCDSSFLTFSGSASCLSILLTATTIGTPAAFACWMASLVCGMTPSSAATTRTTMSVTWAPRARIAVKAAWPGVSRKVTTPRGVSTW